MSHKILSLSLILLSPIFSSQSTWASHPEEYEKKHSKTNLRRQNLLDLKEDAKNLKEEYKFLKKTEGCRSEGYKEAFKKYKFAQTSIQKIEESEKIQREDKKTENLQKESNETPKYVVWQKTNHVFDFKSPTEFGKKKDSFLKNSGYNPHKKEKKIKTLMSAEKQELSSSFTSFNKFSSW